MSKTAESRYPLTQKRENAWPEAEAGACSPGCGSLCGFIAEVIGGRLVGAGGLSAGVDDEVVAGRAATTIHVMNMATRTGFVIRTHEALHSSMRSEGMKSPDRRSLRNHFSLCVRRCFG
ncbi:hypothetical protein [Martelella mediterranea]|uniref:hypothetical protein n=1 Tax=Martelella mediterranea TaxID=293089 RepID=UPI0003760116|nr:hypothetical protein [Martelella mediterranea]